MGIEDIADYDRKKTPKVRDRESEHIVYLPNIKIEGVAGETYNGIPKYGITNAVSEKSAVSKYVMGHCKKKNLEEYGRVILHVLKDIYGGLDNHAVIFPEIKENGKVLKSTDRNKIYYLFLARELASKERLERPEQKHIDKACDLLKKVGRF